MPHRKSDTIAHILKASAIMGSSAVVQIATGIVKNKVVALLLGPVGVGTFSLLQSVQGTVSSVAGLGLGSSGVRQIAESEAREGIAGVSRNYTVLKQVTMAAALLGALLMVLLRGPAARLVGYDGSAGSAAFPLLALGVWAITVSGAQKALLNGLRRIGDLAKVNSYGGLLGMVVTVAAVWLWKAGGIVHAVVGSSLATLLVSWWLIRRIELPSVAIGRSEYLDRSRALVGLGLVFMASAVMTVGSQLGVRAILTRQLGLEATGHFHAAWNISMLYISFALNAMGTDFYPRLTSVAGDHGVSRKMVDEQMEAALLLSGPIILGMLAFAPVVVSILYSSAFGDTVAVLRWQVLGDIFKVASWPMGFVMLAQGSGRAFFVAELLWNASYLLLVHFGIPWFGVNATGISFLAAYVALFGFNMLFAWKIIDYLPRAGNVALLVALLLLALLVGTVTSRLGLPGMVAGGLVVAASAAYSFLRITRSLGGVRLFGKAGGGRPGGAA